MKARRLASKVLYYYQAGGKQIPLGSNLLLAKEKWAQLDAGGKHTSRFPAITRLYRASSEYQALAPNTRKVYGPALDNLDLTFKHFTLEQIEPRHVKQYMRRRTKKGAAIFERRVGSAFFAWAREEGHTKSPNPFIGVKFSKAEKRGFTIGPRHRYVTDAEFDVVYGRGDDILKDAMDLALLTGQRPGDILKARRQDIAEDVLWFVQEKTGAKVGVKVQGALAAAVERATMRERLAPSMYLIADRNGQRVSYAALNGKFRAARGSADWQFRDIRAKAGADSPDLKRAQELLGHAHETTTAGHYRSSRGNVVAPLERKIQDAS